MKHHLIFMLVGVMLVLPIQGSMAEEIYGVLDNGLIGISVSNQGFVGNAFSNRNIPSCEFPRYSGGEHLYLGGLWVGARTPDGAFHVSTSAEDANGLVSAHSRREFEEYDGGPLAPSYRYISNIQNSDDYHPDALAPEHLEVQFDDYRVPPLSGHEPLGIMVELRALGWHANAFDQFVIFDYTIENISGSDLEDVYVGYYNDTTVGNTNFRDPYGGGGSYIWNYYDDINGGWRPGDDLSDPSLWMMYEHDADGDQGLATSWIGCRLLGTTPQVAAPYGKPPVSYNCWSYSRVPRYDDWHYDVADSTTLLPGKYQLMSNGDFDVGVTPDEDYTQPGNRLGLLSTGPFLNLAHGEQIRVVFAVCLGMNGLDLKANSRLAKLLYDHGYTPQLSSVDEMPQGGPLLGRATPNPFNPLTRIPYSLASPGMVRLTVHDLAGRRVRTLVAETMGKGDHEAPWDGTDDSGASVAAGVYFYRLETGSYIETKRMAFVK